MLRVARFTASQSQKTERPAHSGVLTLAAVSTRQKRKKPLSRLLPGRRSALQALAMQLCVSLEWRGQADAPFELWQTGCLYGTVFALRVALVRMQQARRKTARAIRILPEIEKIGKREKWTRSSFEISASSRTSTTASPRWPIASSK